MLVAGMAMMCIAARSGAQGREPFTVRSALQTTRFMVDGKGEAVAISPDGRRYVVMLVTGDVAGDGAWVELRVGRLDSLAAAVPTTRVRLFTHARGGGYARHGGSETLLVPWRNPPRWIDDDHIAFVWEDDALLRQVVSVTVSTGELRYLTSHRSDVTHFSARADGTLLYGAKIPCVRRPSVREQSQGYVVDAEDAFELVHGCGAWARDAQALFAMDASQGVARQVVMRGGDAVNRSTPRLPAALFSAAGTKAIFANTISQIPGEWGRYTAVHFQTMWQALKSEGPGGAYASQFQQLFVIDLASATAQPLWSVPLEPYERLRLAWSPEEDRVVLGPTFLPVTMADAAGLAGEAVAVVPLNGGRVEQLPMAAADARRIRQLRWVGGSQIEVQLDDECVGYRWRGRWQRQSAGPCPSLFASAVQVRVVQGLNEAPRLVARETRSGREAVAVDPNPDLAHRYALGKVEWIEREVEGTRWAGRLYYPADYSAGRRYPLVIQTHSFAEPNEFPLSGRGGPAPARGPGHSAFIAQALASHGFFVLHGTAAGEFEADLLAQTRRRIAATEAVVEQLVREGRVDRQRVGIMGYSASGWDVSYALTHSDFPYAAALTDDNKDGSYSQALVSGWLVGAGPEIFGVQPFGSGLSRWMEESPGFNVERIRTPLLLTASSPGSELLKWELFSRLRFLRRPVEFFIVPDLEHGSHGLQNPTQLLALQERAFDWWRFWLQDERDTDPRKGAQYQRWEVLRRLNTELRARGTIPSASL